MPQAYGDDRSALDAPFELEEGTCYLVRGKAAETSYRFFEHLIQQGTPGLCITRIYPEKVQSRFGLASVPMWWISHSPGDDRYDPSAIGTLAKGIEEFIDDHQEGCVVLLDGIEFIMNNIGFMKCLFFVEHLNEFVMPRRAIVLVPVDPDCFEPVDFARLERFVETIDEPELRRSLGAYEMNRRLLES